MKNLETPGKIGGVGRFACNRLGERYKNTSRYDNMNLKNQKLLSFGKLWGHNQGLKLYEEKRSKFAFIWKI